MSNAGDEGRRRAQFVDQVAREVGMTPVEDGPDAPPPRVPHWSEGASPSDPRWAMLARSRAESPLGKGGWP